MRWSYPRIIQRQSLGGDECTVITIANRINAKCSEKNREGIHGRRLRKFLAANPVKWADNWNLLSQLLCIGLAILGSTCNFVPVGRPTGPASRPSSLRRPEPKGYSPF